MPTKLKTTGWTSYAKGYRKALKRASARALKIQSWKSASAELPTERARQMLSYKSLANAFEMRSYFVHGPGDVQSERSATEAPLQWALLAMAHRSETGASEHGTLHADLLRDTLRRAISAALFERTVDVQSEEMYLPWTPSTAISGWISSLLETHVTMQKSVDELPALIELERAVPPGSSLDFFSLNWVPHHAALQGHQHERLDEGTLTDPKEILRAFESNELSVQSRRELVLFAEPLKFDEQQQAILVRHLWKYSVENRTTRDAEELVALGSAIRKLIAYCPSNRFDEIWELLDAKEGEAARPEMELEVVKGVAYRLSCDAKSNNITCPNLCNAIFELAEFHSSRRVLENDISSAIALNAIIALALLRDDRITDFVTSLPKRSLPWFVSLVRSRASRLLIRLQSENRRSPDSLGLLPKIV